MPSQVMGFNRRPLRVRPGTVEPPDLSSPELIDHADASADVSVRTELPGVDSLLGG
jgi:hypothetical protein